MAAVFWPARKCVLVPSLAAAAQQAQLLKNLIKLLLHCYSARLLQEERNAAQLLDEDRPQFQPAVFDSLRRVSHCPIVIGLSPLGLQLGLARVCQHARPVLLLLRLLS